MRAFHVTHFKPRVSSHVHNLLACDVHVIAIWILHVMVFFRFCCFSLRFERNLKAARSFLLCTQNTQMRLAANKRLLTHTAPFNISNAQVNDTASRTNYTSHNKFTNDHSNRRSNPFLPNRKLNYNRTIKFKTNPNIKKLEHETKYKFNFKQFLGNKNFKNIYKQNPLSNDLSFRDMVPHSVTKQDKQIKNNKVLLTPTVLSSMLSPGLDSSNDNSNLSKTNYITGDPLRPFPQNNFCITNKIIPYSLKRQIYNDYKFNKISPQLLSQRYNLKFVRIMAIIKLYELELNKDNKLLNVLKNNNGIVNKNLLNLLNYNSMMYNYFPHFTTNTVNNSKDNNNTGLKNDTENLTELTNPLNKSIFITLNESEPFGSIDSARFLQREPAINLLNNLTNENESQSNENSAKRKIVYSKLYAKDRCQFKFINEKVKPDDKNEFIYGISNNYGAKKFDNSKYKKLFIDEQGKLQYR